MIEPPESDRSHEFQFVGRALARVLAPTLAGFVAIVAALQLSARSNALPPAAPIEGSDEVLMRRRFAMTHAPSAAEVLIIGDSSSAIDVEAPVLSHTLPGRPEVLNQGMFMGIGMDIYGDAAGEFIRHHPGQVRLVVLLITPGQLQNDFMSPLHQRLWREEMNPEQAVSENDHWRKLLALDAGRERIAGHLVPFTLHGHVAHFYGHPFHLRQHVRAHGGSMVEYGWYNPARATRETGFRVSEQVHREAVELRKRIPAGVTLAVGITPMPETHLPAAFKERRDELLRELNESLGAGHLLTNLPVRLPNGFFASPLHLNPRGAEHFTRLLANELTKLPVW